MNRIVTTDSLFEQNPADRPPARPLADVSDSDRPPRSDGASEQRVASPADSVTQASPPEAASPSGPGELQEYGKGISYAAQWSEPMSHTESGSARSGNPITKGDAASSESHLEAAPEPTGMLALIDRYVRDPSVDVEKFQRLLVMKREMEAHDAEMAFLQAKARVKKQLVNVKFVKTRTVLYDIDKNDKKKGQAEAFRYCPLEDIDKILAPLMAAEDLDLTYTTRPRAGDGGGAVIVGKLWHIQGHWEESEMPLPLDTTGGKSNIQAMGSTNHYGRRYVACNIWNIVVIGDDDDGTGGAIDEAQAATIRNMIKSAGADEKAFLKYMKAASIEAIPYRAYPKAMSALEEKLQKAKNADPA